jgi:hypothetical protein
VTVSNGYAAAAVGMNALTAVPSDAHVSAPAVIGISIHAAPAALIGAPVKVATRTVSSALTSATTTVAAILPKKKQLGGSGVIRHRRSTPVSRAMTRVLAWVTNEEEMTPSAARPPTRAS